MAAKFDFGAKYASENDCIIKVGKYIDGSLALMVYNAYGEVVCRPTVCLNAYGEKPVEGNVFIYGNYSEHVGVAQTLQDNGFLGDVIRDIEFGPFGSYATEHKLLRLNDMDKL